MNQSGKHHAPAQSQVLEELADLVVKLTNEHRTYSVDMILWYEAPLPRRWHRCWAQTADASFSPSVRRCPCGGVSLDYGRWVGRNSRRREQ